MNLSNLVNFNIEVEEKKDFLDNMATSNIQRVELMTRIIIVIEMLLSLIDLVSAILHTDDRFHYNNYLLMYTLLIAVSTIVSVLNRHFKNQWEINYKKIQILVTFYSTFIISWGSIISLMDQKLYGSLTAFIVNMLFTSILLQDRKHALISYISSTLILVLALPFFQPSSDILIGHYINLAIFIIIAWFISRALFYFYYYDFVNNQKLEAANKELKELALIDELTGLANRRSLNEYIEFSHNIKKRTLFSIIMIDIDFFKLYNDTYGHNLGYNVLCSVAKEIKQVANNALDFACRFGGEEFIYIAIDSDREKINELAEIIRTNVFNLKIPHSSSKVSEYVTISLGTSTINFHSKQDFFQCMEFSDRALYEAKLAGRNCVKEKDAV